MVTKLLSYGASLPATKLVPALAEMQRARAGLARAFADVDALLTPTTSHVAPRASSPAPQDQADFTALANVAGVPALAIPVAAASCPVSVQLTGRAWSDRRLIDLAASIEADKPSPCLSPVP